MRGLEIQDPLNAYLPDGKIKDPEGENIQEYFDKAIDPSTYLLRKACPPENFDPLKAINKGKDITGDDYVVPNPMLRPRFDDDSYSGSDSDDEAVLSYIRERGGEIKYEFHPVYGWGEVVYPPGYDSDEEMMDLTDLRKIDKIIRERAENFIKFNELLGLKYDDYDDRENHIRLIERGTRINLGLPPTPVHTPPVTDDELSSDEEGYYSASWVKYGDISSFKHF